ncbi:hypothetical protein GCM10022221_12640 [Actinocorallia aurea]
MVDPGNQDPFPYQHPPQAPGEETQLGTPLVHPGQPQGAPPSFAQPSDAQQGAAQQGVLPHGAFPHDAASQGEAPQPPAAAPQPGPGTPPPFAPGTPPPFPAPQPFAQGTPPPFAPPYGPGYPPQGSPAPFGEGGFPPPPPLAPKPNPVVFAIGAITAIVVVLVAGLVAMHFVRSDDEKKPPEVSMPSVSVPPMPTVSAVPTEAPTLPAASEPRQVPDILKASVKTAFGTTYTRAGTASGKCPSIAPKALRKALAKNPCIGQYRGAVYSSPKKDAVVTVIIMPLKNADAAAAVKRAGKYPYLIAPKKGSGVKSFGKSPVQTWSQIQIKGNLALFAMAYRSDMGKTDKGGVANKASGELGAELSAVLAFQ